MQNASCRVVVAFALTSTASRSSGKPACMVCLPAHLVAVCMLRPRLLTDLSPPHVLLGVFLACACVCVRVACVRFLRCSPGCYAARSDPADVARSMQDTFICSENEGDSGPLNNWMAPADMRDHMSGLFKGCMEGRTMYALACYCLAALSSPCTTTPSSGLVNGSSGTWHTWRTQSGQCFL